jgi:hypothetical protein
MATKLALVLILAVSVLAAEELSHTIYCDEGQWVQGDKCRPCDKTCRDCIAKNANACTKCYFGFTLDIQDADK